MKKSLVMLVLVIATAVAAVAQAAPQQKKEIKDPAEYNAYMGALNQADPSAQANAFEAFLQQYPNTVMKPEALDALMSDYQKTSNGAKLEETASRLSQADPKNVKALAVLTYLQQQKAQTDAPNAAQHLAQAAQFGQQGLQALETGTKPEGVADDAWAKQKTELGVLFNNAIGFNAYQNKDYAAARTAFGSVVKANPNDVTSNYYLGLSDLQGAAGNELEGLWAIARAVALAPAAGKAQISEYGRRKYIRFHGGEDGWTDVLSQAASNPIPPDGFTIKPAPTPAEQAAKMLKDKPVSQMSFDEIQFILTSGNQQAADDLWNQIKGKPIAMQGKVIAADPKSLTIAGSYDDIQAQKADITLAMTTDIPAKLMPKVGADLQFQGNPSEYTPNPFMMQMTDGTLVAAKSAEPAKKTPAKKAPVHHTTTKKKPS